MKQEISVEKITNYKEKTLRNFYNRCKERKASEAEICEFLAWFIENNYYNK